jgi:hypothetical protein
LREVEGELGFSLPSFLTALYTQVADGGFGPGLDVAIPGYSVGVLYPLDSMLQVYRENRQQEEGMPYPPWPDGVVPMLSWGGFAEAAVDCYSPGGTVLLYEADVDEAAPGQAWKIDAPSVEAWWKRWVENRREVPTVRWRRQGS